MDAPGAGHRQPLNARVSRCVPASGFSYLLHSQFLFIHYLSYSDIRTFTSTGNTHLVSFTCFNPLSVSGLPQNANSAHSRGHVSYSLTDDTRAIPSPMHILSESRLADRVTYRKHKETLAPFNSGNHSASEAEGKLKQNRGSEYAQKKKEKMNRKRKREGIDQAGTAGTSGSSIARYRLPS